MIAMREIEVGRLWTGNAREARDSKLLSDCAISAVVDLAYEEPPAQLPRHLIYCWFPMVDGSGNDSELLKLALMTTVGLLRGGIRTLVACSAGMSRSPTVAVCALAVHQNESPDEVLSWGNRQAALELHGELWSEVAQIARQLQAENS